MPTIMLQTVTVLLLYLKVLALLCMTCAMVTFPQGVTEVGCDVTVELDVAGDTAGIYNIILHTVHVYPLYLSSRHVKIFSSLSDDPEDFNVTTSTYVTFPSGTTNDGDNECITIAIMGDDIYEEDQQFTVEFESVTPTTAASVGSPSSASVTIQNNNGLYELD